MEPGERERKQHTAFKKVSADAASARIRQSKHGICFKDRDAVDMITMNPFSGAETVPKTEIWEHKGKTRGGARWWQAEVICGTGNVKKNGRARRPKIDEPPNEKVDSVRVEILLDNHGTVVPGCAVTAHCRMSSMQVA
jgi:hypothetical protein